MANCKQCGQEYEAKRSTSHYCSPKCKQEFYRNRMSTVTPKSVTLRPVKPVTVTEFTKTKFKRGVTAEGMTKLTEAEVVEAKAVETNAMAEAKQGSTGVTGSCCVGHEHNFTGEITKPKRGKDIKCFADLPPDVQATINQMSKDDNGKIVEAEKAKRTAAAVKYQHLFPDRYHSTGVVCLGVVTGKPGDADYNGICTPEWRAERGR